MSIPHVSVLMLAYNHEKYIEDAIKSVISQNYGNFKLIIGEDCSTDNTRHICKYFAKKYPDKITLLLSDKNLGIQKNARRTSQAAFSSKYIAYCEGDDRWTDTKKISYQVEWLENNHQFIAHAHNVKKINLLKQSESLFGKEIDCEMCEDDLIESWPFHIVSLMVKNDILKIIPYKKLPNFISGDRFLNIWISCHGRIFYEGTKIMAIYNLHDSGASARSDYLAVRYQDIEMLKFLRSYIKNSAIYNNKLAKTIQHIALLSLNKSESFNYIKNISLIPTYINSTHLNSYSNYYFLLMLIFRNFFYYPYNLINDVFSRKEIN